MGLCRVLSLQEFWCFYPIQGTFKRIYLAQWWDFIGSYHFKNFGVSIQYDERFERIYLTDRLDSAGSYHFKNFGVSIQYKELSNASIWHNGGILPGPITSRILVFLSSTMNVSNASIWPIDGTLPGPITSRILVFLSNTRNFQTHLFGTMVGFYRVQSLQEFWCFYPVRWTFQTDRLGQ